MVLFADTMLNEIGTGFVFFANIKEDNTVNYIAKSSCSVNAGLIVKSCANQSDGNGGGSPTFAQGGGKNAKALKDILDYVEKSLKDAE